jgi:hypothetical protein
VPARIAPLWQARHDSHRQAPARLTGSTSTP